MVVEIPVDPESLTTSEGVTVVSVQGYQNIIDAHETAQSALYEQQAALKAQIKTLQAELNTLNAQIAATETADVKQARQSVEALNYINAPGGPHGMPGPMRMGPGGRMR